MNTELKLAQLKGTEKQIKWAEEIRKKMLSCKYPHPKLARITSAAWFIRMRNKEVLGCHIVRQIALEKKRTQAEEKLPADYDENEHFYSKLAVLKNLLSK